jgi:tRNA pseudouridine55 synthase
VDGVLVVDKPQGLTSHDVVAAARRALGERRIGHTGTLDPLATGVLPLACGRATRLARFLTASDKDYDAVIAFGRTTDTDDVAGAETSRSDRRPDAADVERALVSLTGTYPQIPPAYSAKKVAGRRAYVLARRDEPVALTPVTVTVSRAALMAFDGRSARVALTCSAGFYVRSFARTLGELVSTGACLEALRRTRSGDFEISDAVPLAALIENPTGARERTVPLDLLLPALPAISLDAEQRVRVSHGQEVPAPGDLNEAEDATGRDLWVRLLDADGHLVALATPGTRPGSLHPAVVLI